MLFSAFADSIMNDSLLQPIQHLKLLLLQFADITDPLLIVAILLFFADLIVTKIQFRATRRPQNWQDE